LLDFSIFATPEAWVSLVTLTFLEIVLGVDNIVFIVITTDRLPKNEQHIGRKLGLLGAMVSRIIFLCFASYLVHLTTPLFTISLPFYQHGFAVRELVLFFGGVYLIYKGIDELHSMMNLDDLREIQQQIEHPEGKPKRKKLNLPEAVGTIMVMDVVFSIDSVITAVGMADHLLVMIIAVMSAIFLMMIFIDPISNFINKHSEMKILALTFIVVIGVLLVTESLGFGSSTEIIGIALEKFVVYVAMALSFILALLQIHYKQRVERWGIEHGDAARIAIQKAHRAPTSEAVTNTNRGDNGSQQAKAKEASSIGTTSDAAVKEKESKSKK